MTGPAPRAEGAVSGARFAGFLLEAGFDLFTGVPCSMIEDLIVELESSPHASYLPAVREDAAVGLAGGAWLGGRRPAVLLQNSGLGTSLNALASFSLMYGLPALLLVTWRGHEGRDAPEHLLTGEITPHLLELLDLPYRVLSRESAAADVAWAAGETEARLAPVALLLPPGVLATGEVAAGEAPPSAPGVAARATRPPLTPSLSRLAALRAVVKDLDREPVVHANGYICRESFSVADRPQNFYMIGSMGLASSIGLGVALARPDLPTLVFDGDGNVLMNLGTLAQVGAVAPPNLVHVVFDNSVYGSTGNQRSLSASVRLDALAEAAGYRRVAAVTDADALVETVRAMRRSDGPHFVLVKVTTEEASVPRIPHTPPEIRDRFRAGVRTA
ncbi:MAG: phosphonopyruvate decarboxylase [Candidatus Rokubacteria bacterium]|nr:phosphonopyruvate decarboxylase [Candidatus Rokubacteria bacterium]